MDAERRQVTVLFTDVVGFTSFSERSGEEAAFTLMRSLSNLMDDVVREHGGVVQSFTGDGIMAVFGAPVAFEDAPLRACRAALSMQQRLQAAEGNLAAKHGLRPQLRIGLNTGPAVVGSVQGGSNSGVTVLGDTVNLASRLQSLAEPGKVLLSEGTHSLVQGMIEASFAGEHEIKGKSKPQRVYRLDAIRHGTTRFGATVIRGLGAFVGRERELELLERELGEARSELRVIDIVAEPGMGKSRLLHEFRQRVGKERAFVLSGSCSPDGQQTPFLPFIEVVHGSFRVSTGEEDRNIARKLELGLTTLGLSSAQNLGLLLHLLGLKPPEDALTGLDGVLIGLRTRELLQKLLEVRCRLSPVLMMIEDLHWIDSVSEEVLRKIIDSGAKLRLLLVVTRRPEYEPPWLDRSVVTKLRVEPLPVGHIRRLIQARLGVDRLPETLTRQVTEKAEGNPLFAEEMVSYLTERGIIRTTVHFDASAVAAALPASLQAILNARVDRLGLQDRAVLQAASVIGRRFDPQLLAAAIGETDVDGRLAAMQALDLIRIDGKSGEYAFKHALVRDALYQSLLTEPRTALHAKIAEEIERRNGNRLAEVVEVLAHHYSQTDRTRKAFIYLTMAGSKSLSVYSLDEAAAHLTAASALLENKPDCGNDDEVAEFLVSYALLLNLNRQAKLMIDVLQRHFASIRRLGDDLRTVLIRHHLVLALYFNTRYREAAAMQQEILQIADHLGDNTSKAYALCSEMFVSTILAPRSLGEFDALKIEAVRAATDSQDVYIQNLTWFAIGWDLMHRGRIDQARDAARELMRVGATSKDPRSTGLGLVILTWIALVSDSYAEALEYSEQSLAVAVTPWDQYAAVNGKGCALVLLRQTEEGIKLLEADRRRCIADGDLWQMTGNDPVVGVCKVFQGDIAGGIRFLEDAISRREEEGYQVTAEWYGLLLCEVYLQIIGGNEKPPLMVLFKNLPILLKVMATATARISALTRRVLDDPRFCGEGYFVGRAQMALGLLHKIKKRHGLALQHLTEARRILAPFGQSPMLTRLEAALADLGQGGSPFAN